ncbi:DUF3040 domain-containing protein [Actinoplanes sp. NPDC026670]|uniref:DUF3040 domain-containing protein n=1 Tax=Actinoplanes sp. NPDC026670 TaxID=3154700 RepID=UPI0033E80EA7
MLNDDDRRTIAELERRIHLSDPDFAARMDGTHRDVPFPVVAVLCAALFILVPPAMLLFGWPGLVVVLDLFVAGVVVVLVRRHLRR